MKQEISQQEWELIDSIRNYKKVYPRSVELEMYIDFLLDELMK